MGVRQHRVRTIEQCPILVRLPPNQLPELVRRRELAVSAKTCRKQVQQNCRPAACKVAKGILFGTLQPRAFETLGDPVEQG
jgi:hypothetical protein